MLFPDLNNGVTLEIFHIEGKQRLVRLKLYRYFSISNIPGLAIFTMYVVMWSILLEGDENNLFMASIMSSMLISLNSKTGGW